MCFADQGATFVGKFGEQHPAIFGVIGTVVATPLLVCGQTAVWYLWTERRLEKPAEEPQERFSTRVSRSARRPPRPS